MCITSRMSNSPLFHSLKIHSRFGEDRCLLRRWRGQGRLTIRGLAMRRSSFPWSSAVRTAGWKRRCRGLLVLLQQRRHSLPVKSDKSINRSINQSINQSNDTLSCTYNTDSVQPPAQNRPFSTYVREKECTKLWQVKFSPETQPESIQINRKTSILPPTITSLFVLTWRQCRSAWRSTARLGSGRMWISQHSSLNLLCVDWLIDCAPQGSQLLFMDWCIEGVMECRSDRLIDWLAGCAIFKMNFNFNFFLAWVDS